MEVDAQHVISTMSLILISIVSEISNSVQLNLVHHVLSTIILYFSKEIVYPMILSV